MDDNITAIKDAPVTEPAMHKVTLNINGQAHELAVQPWVTLLDALREKLDLTGTKKGCDHGQCGACTVLINGKRVNSCLTLAVMQNGKEITTIEGIGNGSLHPVQQAFIKYDAFQCGYCTPGQICSAIGMLKEGHVNNREDVKELMSGNLCRCGAYNNIVEAIMEVREAGNYE
ncbi:(2Fe-2S)-binding protein [Mucilaginibacter sp.]|uniref:(2Fe-2S)-binding protein n=1 Tax=Mucilaginibacter sp. TaxID=1882438 RepID=UPI0035BC262A